MTGEIFSIQKYALHDGPGIRTTVFMKGCPLTCQWCHNPESISNEQEKIFYKDKCIGCNTCNDLSDPENCPSEALQYVSKTYSVDQLYDEIIKDHVFYEQSGGGITFSGGEPLLQVDFLVEVLKVCKKHDLHVTIDTCGFVPWEKFEKVLPYVDLFLYDIKHTDSKVHHELTGVDNELILNNFNKLIQVKDVYVRLPILKGINDQVSHFNEVISLSKSDHVLQVNILQYHNYAENKYEDLMNDYVFRLFERPSDESLEEIKIFFQKQGIKAIIGG